MRHGMDPDHLTAIDGLSRLRPRATIGLYFALGHGLVVTLLAVGIGRMVSDRAAFLSPWILITIGFVNLVKVFKGPTPPMVPQPIKRAIVVQPFLLGMLLAAGFETASQFSALCLAGNTNPWVLGAAFTLGMVLVDGLDGYLAVSTLRGATKGGRNTRDASRLLAGMVVLFSFGIGGGELLGFELEHVALPLGLLMFAAVIVIRLWANSRSENLAKGVSLAS